MNEQIQNKEYWDSLIIDYLSQNISDDDRIKLMAWLLESDEHKCYLNQMKELWDSSAIMDGKFPFNYKHAYSVFEMRIRQKSISRPKKVNLFWRRIAMVAAVLVPFLFLSYYTFLYFESEQSRSGLQLSEIASPKGSKTQLRLADGTEVCLNSGSVIQYGEGFGTKNRVLKLSGEAYLKVKHNEQLPFVVMAGDLEVRVLGTEFNVDAYPDEEDIKVALFKGSVSLSDKKGNKSVILKPMETGVFQHASRKITIVTDNTDNSLNWMYDRLIFKGETFKEIARLLERHFNVEIRIHNEELSAKRFGGDFQKGETLDQILKVMAASEKFTYKINGSIIDIN